MPRIARRFIVEGRVQGVFFRDSTRNIADPLGIRGHAINLSDGTVEVLACGSIDAIARLRQWLEEGPPMSRVSHVSEEIVEAFETDTFRVG